MCQDLTASQFHELTTTTDNKHFTSVTETSRANSLCLIKLFTKHNLIYFQPYFDRLKV